MKGFKYTLLVFLLSAANLEVLHGQSLQNDTLTVVPSSIKMMGEVHEREVLLRWAPTDARAWKLLNEHGVRLERLTMVRAGQILDEPEVVQLSGRMKPEESDEFISVAGEYSYAAIIAQAIFGDSFEVSGGGGGGIESIIAQSDELQQRFALSLYAADLCFPAALAVGWGFEDLTVRKDEKYLYRVVSLVPEEDMVIEPGLLFVETEQIDRFPSPLDFSGQFMDGNVLLSWDSRVLQSLYAAYVPERSTDGVNFEPITETPITQMDSTGNDMIVYADSIVNNITYYYRLAGLTPFGSKSAYSDTISGMGLTELRSPPFITRAIPDQNGGVTIEWEFDPQNEELIESFSLERSDDDKIFSDYTTHIDKTLRSITASDIPPSNYFAITANSIAGKRVRSFSALVQTVDTLPPAVPTGLRAIADTTGVVRLSWQANSDNGILGYRIYRGQTAEEELVPLNDIAHRDTVFVDSISMQTLNRSVYYAITALDERYNQSDKTPVVEVERPEIIPPTAPFIRHIDVDNGRNAIQWIGGGESNLAGYNLYRKSDPDENFELLVEIPDPWQHEYVDTDIENNRVYIYRVTSRSRGGLVSLPSPDYKVTGINKSRTTIPLTFDVIPVVGMIKLVWNTPITDVTNIQIYKKTGDGAYGLMSEGLASDGEIEDRDVIPGAGYGYMIVVRSNGAPPATIEKRGAL